MGNRTKLWIKTTGRRAVVSVAAAVVAAAGLAVAGPASPAPAAVVSSSVTDQAASGPAEPSYDPDACIITIPVTDSDSNPYFYGNEGYTRSIADTANVFPGGSTITLQPEQYMNVTAFPAPEGRRLAGWDFACGQTLQRAIPPTVEVSQVCGEEPTFAYSGGSGFDPDIRVTHSTGLSLLAVSALPGYYFAMQDIGGTGWGSDSANSSTSPYLLWFYEWNPQTCGLAQTVTWTPTTELTTADSPWTPDVLATSNGDGVISYTVADPGSTGCTVDPATGLLTFTAPGSCTVTATASQTDTYVAGSTDVTFTIESSAACILASFQRPFDSSTAAHLVTNTIKNGRVAPIKVALTDTCAGAPVDETATVTIAVSRVAGTGSTPDPVETYADAGQSSAGTDMFRLTGDFWTYNLDTRALGLTVGNTYRIDVFINGMKATTESWILVQPVR